MAVDGAASFLILMRAGMKAASVSLAVSPFERGCDPEG